MTVPPICDIYYLARPPVGNPIPKIDFKKNRQAQEEELIERVFEAPMHWGYSEGNPKFRPPHIVIGTISRQRPRWVIELCKEAAKRAVKRESSKVTLNDIKACLEDFGQRRVSDTIVEFRTMCPEIEELLTAFSNQAEDYKTDELLTLIDRKILNHVTVSISGVIGKAPALAIAQFLFSIGFITARKELSTGEYEHYSYVDKPELLKSRTNLDQGFSWEIHPVFRQVLQIRDCTGTKTKRLSRG